MTPRQESLPSAQHEVLLELQRIPNVGPATARDLLRLGVRRLDDLVEREARDMYDTLCALDGVLHDICMLDVFTAVVSYARGEQSRPWWMFTAARIEAERSRRVTGGPDQADALA
ncbi:MAG TPA: helix-hairpin-helix domain-containing protein [Gemmatimonadaceae bacterium]